MPRLSATRPAAGRPAQARSKPKKAPVMQDRLTARTLFFRRLRRSLRPGLWILGGLFTIALGSELFRAMPAFGPVLSPISSLRHGAGALAAYAGFRVTHIEINGADTTPLPVIQAALGVGPGDPILGFSLADAAARIEQLGPVQTAVVERALPGTLIVNITERAPYAVWQTGGSAGSGPKFVVIDKGGKVIADQDAIAAKRRNPALLLLAGQDAPENAAALMAELAAYPTVKSHVAAAERVDSLRWNLILQNNTVVKLPAENEQQAIARLAALQSSMALLDRPVEVIDLRLNGRMVVRPYPASASVAPGTAPANPPGGNGASPQADHT